MKDFDKPIGFFDSGVGGISVLKEAINIMPQENYIYLGDSKNAPYGTKRVQEVVELSKAAVDFLVEKGVKAVVVACNTATSAAIDILRDTYSPLPIIGIEPALKPAVELKKRGKIIIMATPMTLAERKFNNLMQQYAKKADIVPLPCAGLVELIEANVLDGEVLEKFLEEKLSPFMKKDIAAIVLGCTHYPFIKKSLWKVLKSKVEIIDGSAGTARQLLRQLEGNNMLRPAGEKGEIKIYNSGESKYLLDLSYRLLDY